MIHTNMMHIIKRRTLSKIFRVGDKSRPKPASNGSTWAQGENVTEIKQGGEEEEEQGGGINNKDRAKTVAIARTSKDAKNKKPLRAAGTERCA